MAGLDLEDEFWWASREETLWGRLLPVESLERMERAPERSLAGYYYDQLQDVKM